MGRNMAIDQNILDAAADWHAGLEGDTPDYEGFADWLEADVRHRDAYDRVIALDMLVVDHSSVLLPRLPANDDAPSNTWGYRRLAGMAAAVALVIGTGALTMRETAPDRIAIASKKGQSKLIQLADSSAVTLDGNSSISYLKGSERSITLTKGSAHFAVKHDAAKPFFIAAGRYQIRDLGTEFTVSRVLDHLSISVSSGLVDISGPGMSRLAVSPGERIDFANGKFEKSKVEPADVGSWRQGRLIYNNAPLRLVVADINRYVDQTVQIDPALSDRHFSGVLTIGNGSQLAPTLANVMAIPLKKDGNVVHLGAGRTR
jgi:transmembrane sensor